MLNGNSKERGNTLRNGREEKITLIIFNVIKLF